MYYVFSCCRFKYSFSPNLALKFFGSPAGPTQSRTQKLLVWSLIQVLDHLRGRSTIELKSLEVSVRKENREMALKLFHDITANRPSPLVEGSGDVPDKVSYYRREVYVRKENREMGLKLFHDITANRPSPLVEGSGDVPDKVSYGRRDHPKNE